MKQVDYRGGVIRFQVPDDWVVELEPSGGGTLYQEGENTGTLRINVLDFMKGKQSSGSFESMGYKPFRENCYIKSERRRFCEDGEEYLLLNWQIAYDIEPKHYRVISLSHTVAEESLQSQQTQRELEVIKQIMWMAEFGKYLGTLG